MSSIFISLQLKSSWKSSLGITFNRCRSKEKPQKLKANKKYFLSEPRASLPFATPWKMIPLPSLFIQVNLLIRIQALDCYRNVFETGLFLVS